MKFALVACAVLAVAAAQFPDYDPTRYPYGSSTPAPFNTVAPPYASISNEQNANIIRYANDIGPDGSYSYAYETDNGIAAQEQGTPRDFGGNPPVKPVVVQGSYAYTSPEGIPIAISYIADENGFQPTGDAIPTPPPIPPQILRSLEYIRANSPAAPGFKK